jgi:anti-sigma factor (TIGR02949 family)
LLTCKDFLAELSDFLDESLSPEERRELENHINACPNCWVLADTTRRTVQIYKDAELYELPEEVRNRLAQVLEKKMASKKC